MVASSADARSRLEAEAIAFASELSLPVSKSLVPFVQ